MLYPNQGWGFDHSLIAHLLICSNRLDQMSDLLRSLRTNEQKWANRSGHSCQKNNFEQIAQAAQDKRETVSDSLRSLMINERMN